MSHPKLVEVLAKAFLELVGDNLDKITPFSSAGYDPTPTATCLHLHLLLNIRTVPPRLLLRRPESQVDARKLATLTPA